MRYRLMVGVTLCVCPAFVSPAAAQQAADPTTSAVQDIVVTARKRSETEQTVPATVSVIDSNTIDAKSVKTFTDISLVAPSVNISNSPTPGSYSITIRGLGSEPGNPSFDSSVSMFVDGVYTPRSREFADSMFDIGDIETIKGTQAALLGKNTSLGAVNLVVRKPGDHLGADVLYTHEFELGGNRIEGGLDLPVTDTLRLRVAGFHDDEPGAIYNTIVRDRGPDARSQAGRVVAVWKPTPDLDVTGMYQIYGSHSRGANAEFVEATATPATLAALAGFPGVFDGMLNDRTADYSTVVGIDHGTQDAQRGSLTVNWHLGGHIITAQSGYTRSTSNSVANTSYIPGNYGYQLVDDESKQFTQELRIASPQGRPVEYLAGLLYLHGTYDNDTTTNANIPTGPTTRITGTSLTRFDQTDEAISGFGELDVKPVDRLKLSLGLRYTSEKKSVDLGRTTLIPGIYSLVVNPPYAPFSMSRREGNVDASLGLSYQLTPTVLVYGSIGQGTKAGGYAQAASLLNQSRYDPERARTAELGFKSQFAERRITINAAAFYTAVHDFQLVTFNGVNFDVDNTNLRTYGVESEAAWAATPWLRFYWNNTYAHAEDTITHNKTTHAPRWSGIAGAAITPRVSAGVRLSAYADVSYRSSEVGQRDQSTVVPIPHSTRLNAGFGFEGVNSGWSIRLIAKNLTNEHVFGFVFPAPLEPAGNVIAIPLEPRTIALQLGFRY